MKLILEKANTQRVPLTELYSLTLPKAKNYNCKICFAHVLQKT